MMLSDNLDFHSRPTRPFVRFTVSRRVLFTSPTLVRRLEEKNASLRGGVCVCVCPLKSQGSTWIVLIVLFVF